MNGRMTMLRRALAAVITAAALVALAMPASAQHRARLSSDLAAELGSPTRAAVPVIVKGDAAALQALAGRHGLRVRKVLEAGVVLEGSAGQLDAAAADPAFAHMSLDAEVRGQMAVTREAIGATLVYGNFVRPRGYTGRNVGIAVIDSGIDPAYQGLDRRLIVSKDFTGTGVDDGFGHGTHIVDLIAGADHGGNFGGVAPDARIVSLKVLQADGSGRTSDVLAALEWLRANHRRYQVRIVNISLGHPVFESYEDDPLAQAVQRLIDEGLVVVASAGNYGKVKSGRPGRARVRRHLVAGQPAGCHHGGRAEHVRHRRSRRRLGGHLQLEGPDRVRQGAEAGSGGARQQDLGLHGGRHHRAWRHP